MKAKNNGVNAKRLRELLRYDSVTGKFFWLKYRCGLAPAGSEAGTIRGEYLTIRIDGRGYLAHRLAWLYVHSVWPRSSLDHKNGDGFNNVIENLREATHTQNKQNQIKASRHSTTGLLGVCIQGNGKFKAVIQANGKIIRLGSFATPEMAHAAYLEAKKIFHPHAYINERKL